MDLYGISIAELILRKADTIRNRSYNVKSLPPQSVRAFGFHLTNIIYTGMPVQTMSIPNPTSTGAVISGTAHMNTVIIIYVIGQNNDIYKRKHCVKVSYM